MNEAKLINRIRDEEELSTQEATNEFYKRCQKARDAGMILAIFEIENILSKMEGVDSTELHKFVGMIKEPQHYIDIAGKPVG